MSFRSAHSFKLALLASFLLDGMTPLLSTAIIPPAHAASKYSTAQKLLDKNQFKESIVESEKLLKSDPGDERAHLLHVEALRALRRLKEAHEEICKVIEANPKSSDAYASRAGLYLAADKPKLAARDIEQALTLNPKNAEAFNYLGLLRFHYHKDRLGAIKVFSQAIKLKPSYAPAIRHRGILRFQIGQYAEAKEDLDRAIQLEPMHSDAFNSRGRVLHALKKYQQAIEDFDRAIKLDPNYDSPYTNKGLALVKLGRLKEAIECYTKAIKINPGAQNYCNRGTAYFRMNKLEDAERDIKKAIAIDPKFANAHNNLGALYKKTGRTEMGLKELEFAVRLDQSDVGLRRNRGQLLLEQGHLEEAMIELKQTAPVQRRTGNIRNSDFKSVINDCTKMMGLNPGNIDLYYDRGFAYFCIGQWDAALSDLDKFRTTSATTNRTAANAAILSNFALRRKGLMKEAQVPVNQVLKSTSAADRDYWAYRFLEYLSGAGAGHELIKTLLTLKLNKTRTTELKCYYAIDRIIAGDKTTAKAQLDWVKEFGDRDTDEFDLAMTELARLSQSAN